MHTRDEDLVVRVLYCGGRCETKMRLPHLVWASGFEDRNKDRHTDLNLRYSNF